MNDLANLYAEQTDLRHPLSPLFSYVGAACGRDFSLPCVFVTRVRNGLVVESRNYVDHADLSPTS